MLYPENIEAKLGFDKVREFVKQECVSSLGTSYVEKIIFSDDFSLIQKLLEQTEEFRKILSSGEYFPSNDYIDTRPYLNKGKVPGAFLTEEEFHHVKLSLKTIYNCLYFFKDDGKAEKYPLLCELSGSFQLDNGILNIIESKIDEKGVVRNNASKELQEIRSTLISEQVRLRKVLDTILRNAKSQGFTTDDVSVTIRNGRMVIPVNAEHKRKIKGFIHDESSTGQTVFLEPTEVLEINNFIRELEYRERREIVRILIALTDFLRPHIPSLYRAYQFLGTIDFIRAKARFALQINGVLPELYKDVRIEWFNAIHPLLYLSFKGQNRKVVPLNVSLHSNQRVLVISGPNAGGKSVCLKTVGLLQYMLQSGLLVPLNENSRVGIFKNLFIDIGDEQSLENDLSTYSSHLKNMKYFLEFSEKKTLILIDEFGTGTEPNIGGAIAETILSELNQLKVFGIITTHYANLKEFANHTPGILNGAMRFDVEQLDPLYILEMGKPGSSFALEIARKIGLPQAVLQKVRKKIGPDQIQFEKLLLELELEKKKFQDQISKVASKDAEMQKMLKEYSELKEYLEASRKKILNDAKSEAKNLIKEANQKIENTIRIIKETKADKEETKEARVVLEDFKTFLEPEKEVEQKFTQIIVEKGEIKEGDLVRVKNQSAVGDVISIKGKDAEIRIGELKSNIKLIRLEKITRSEYKKHPSERIPMQGYNINQKMMDFSTNLDLRGKRAEEAISLVENYIDRASMLGIQEVRIIHGKGEGILKEVVRDHLKSFAVVQNAKDEHVERGGSGVTVVALK
ncbi:MAG: Smr/MutS family protein [Bacteroidota bacterium]|nr:Smr/MutS family protein [Bacteroidota bacterium]